MCTNSNRIYMHVLYTYICIYIKHTCMCLHVFIQTYIHTYIHTCLHVSNYTHTHTHTHTYIYIYIRTTFCTSHIYTRMTVFTFFFNFFSFMTYMCNHIHVLMYSCKLTHIHTYMHAYIQTCPPWSNCVYVCMNTSMHVCRYVYTWICVCRCIHEYMHAYMNMCM